MAHRSVGHPVGLAIVLKVRRWRHLGGPYSRAMTRKRETVTGIPVTQFSPCQQSRRLSQWSYRTGAYGAACPKEPRGGIPALFAVVRFQLSGADRRQAL